MNGEETINGMIERVAFHSLETGFAVLRVKIKGKPDLVTVIGSTPSVSAGELVEAAGRWGIDKNHGPQFKADQLKTTHPASAEGIEKYLASGAIRSIGPKTARLMVSAYGERTLEIVEKFPTVLLTIKGIGPKKLKRITQSWTEQKEVRKIILFMTEHGITSGRAVRIYRTYGQESIARIKENPYQLAEDIRGIGFKTADELAAKLGIDKNSPFRAKAAVRHTLQELAAQGHCGYPETTVIELTVKLVEVERPLIQTAVAAVLDDKSVVREEVDGTSWLYLAALFRAETGLAQAVRRLLTQQRHPLPSVDLEKAIPWVEQKLQIQLAAAQKEAIRQSCRHKLLVITGGPGVGKTTLVRSILEIFAARKLNCVLAAPTGRAAKRLAETTGRTAKTIHRLLEYDASSGAFVKNAQNPLEGDLFVLDEMSMVDVVLGYSFLRAVPQSACVILVGDVDQLPSVGPGAVLADLIDSGAVPVVRLTEIFRQASESQIITAAYDVNQGRMPNLVPPEKLSDFYFVEVEEPEQIQAMLVKLVKERIPARFSLDPKADVQVLSPMNRSLLGARNLNQVLQTALNPGDGGPEVQRFGWTFRIGDRVIQTVNDYERDVFNGDLGIIENINRIEQELTVNYEGRAVKYDFGDLDAISLAYVLSIHKSQGSEFPCVIIPLHTQHYLMLQRNLLYTAVTRGKRLVVVVGTRKALGMAIRQQDTRKRLTGMMRRLREFAGE